MNKMFFIFIFIFLFIFSCAKNPDKTVSEGSTEKCLNNFHLENGQCVANFKVTNCPNLPANAQYNNGATTTMSWNGTSWIVSDGANNCSYSCLNNYTLNNSNGSCEPNSVRSNCSGIPLNATYWESTFAKVWDGTQFVPVSKMANYSVSAGGECSFHCNFNYSFSSGSCVPAQQNGICSAIPQNASFTSSGEFIQTWNGFAFTPISVTSSFSLSVGTICGFKCNNGYSWNGTSCEADTIVQNCPASVPINASFNNGSTFTQTWNGSAFSPTVSENTHSLSAGVCTYSCNANYNYNAGSCVASQQSVSCPNLATNAHFVGMSTYTQTWNGTIFSPNISANINSADANVPCSFLCNTGYSWNGTSCEFETISENCPQLIQNASFVNNVSTYPRTWNGSDYIPSSILSNPFDPSGSKSCSFKCVDGYAYIGVQCQPLGNQLSGIKKIHASFDTKMIFATDESGNVWAWGKNTGLAFGDNSLDTTELVAKIGSSVIKSTSPSIEKIAKRYDSQCAMFSDNSIKCWGLKWDLGDDTYHFDYLPVVPVTPTGLEGGVLDISSSSGSSPGSAFCAVSIDSSIKCWGVNNTTGVLGIGVSGGPTIRVPTAVVDEFGSPIFGFTKVYLAYDRGCGIKTNGDLFCWGNATHSTFAENGQTLYAKKINSISSVKDISISQNNLFVILNDGYVKAVGYQQSGTLANGVTDSSSLNYFVDIVGLGKVKKISIGDYHGCAITIDDKVKCWGAANNGTISGYSTAQLNPVDVAVDGIPDDIVVTTFNTCIKTTNGLVKCSGSNTSGLNGGGQLTTDAATMTLQYVIK